MNVKNCDCTAENPDLIKKIQPLMPKDEVILGVSNLFKIMGDKTRMRLLWALDNNELCVNDLAVLLNMTKSAVSHQLKVLKDAKLAKSKKNGKNVLYSLNDYHVQIIFEKALEHVLEEWIWYDKPTP